MLLPASGCSTRDKLPSVKRLDPAMASMFHMDWLVPLDATTEDDYTRAVSEKAEVLLQSAKFMSERFVESQVDMEVRVWVEAACGNACVSVTWEPGAQRFGFHLLDESLRERLACVVFHALPCVDAEESLQQADRILDAALFALSATHGRDLDEVAEAIRASETFVRVEVQDPAREHE